MSSDDPVHPPTVSLPRGRPLSAIGTGGMLQGAHRYQLLRSLGEGGQGAVYEAEDLENGQRVAVKLLRGLSMDALPRFKREFRIRERISHPSLVEFGELAEYQGTWFFTMTLVRGSSLLDYVGKSELRLRSVFAQLADAIMALHTSGVLHRDIKSENVLVTEGQRVMLLDLGLATEAKAKLSTQVLGTPVYMAPEQWSGVTASRATDWYAFGTLLFEALTGRLPFEGNGFPLLIAKTQSEAPTPQSITGSAPADLCDLCLGLLRRDPEQRFGQDEVRACFGLTHAKVTSSAGETELIGRDLPLEELSQALEEAQRGKSVLVFVEAPSGMGKTRLLETFMARMSQAGTQWILHGRCYENEHLPFKAVDQALDRLARLLRAQSKDKLAGYRPLQAHLLVRVFPALSCLSTHAGADAPEPVDPAEVRLQAIQALIELLQRMAVDGPIVICLDDLQWTDAESVELIARIMECKLPLIVIAALRTEPALRSPIHALTPNRTLRLKPLSVEFTQALALTLAPEAHAMERSVFEQLHRDAMGNPLLICEWARHVQAHRTTPGQGLRELLVARVSQLTPARMLILSTVALCVEPLEATLLFRATHADAADDARFLCHEGLLRSTVRNGDLYFDTFHDRIREVVTTLVAPEQRRAIHTCLIGALQEAGAAPERLVPHHLGADEPVLAAQLALRAARSAEDSLAFERAAQRYDLALKLCTFDRETQVDLRVRKAHAFRRALRPHLAGLALLEASRLTADASEARELARSAGEQLLLSGDLKAGLDTLAQALSETGLHMCESAPQAVGEALERLVQLMQRGLTVQRCAPQDAGDHEARARLCLTLARSLHHVDLRGVPFAIAGLSEALDLGDLKILQEAHATFVMVTASHLPNPLVDASLAQCRELTDLLADPYAEASLCMATAEVEHFRGDYVASARACEKAESILLDACEGVSRELGQVRSLLVVMHHSDKGDFASLLGPAREWLADADRRGDLFHANWLRAAAALAWMAAGDPERARREIARAELAWPGVQGGTFETACVLYLDALDRYEDRANVHTYAGQDRKSVLTSPVALTPLLRGYLDLQRAWGSLRELGARPDKHTEAEKTELRALLRRATEALRGLKLRQWTAVADALEANGAVLDGNLRHADQLLEQAQSHFEDGHLFALAACARRRRGELSRSSVGPRWVAEADAELRRLGVSDPARFARTYWSPFAAQTSASSCDP